MTILRKILAFSLLGLSVSLMLPQLAYAGTEEWKEVHYCENTLGLITFKEADSLGFFKGPKGDLANLVIEEKYDNYCVDTKLVNDIIDKQSQNSIEYCGAEGGVEYFYAKRRKDGDDTTNVRCCPQGFPYITALGLDCCSNQAPAACENERGKDGFYADLGSNEFPDASVGYSCESSNCFTNLANELLENDKRTYLSEADKTQRRCWGSVGVAMSVPDEMVIDGDKLCFNGRLIPKGEYERWGSLIGLYATCMDSPDPNEQKRCVACYEDCVGYDACPLIYNSMGCIDTNPQGLITRVFQIGIGVIGAVGIVRVMQAAFMRQSGDPAKIKESYDIISSVIIGAILLIFGIVILRFIGVNVLQILPFDFLQ